MNAQHIKKYTLASLSGHLTKDRHSLGSALSSFPNKGLNFKVWHKFSPSEYFVVKQIKQKDHKHAKYFGIRYKEGVRTDDRLVKILESQKKELWRFEVTPGECWTDNGVKYDVHETWNLIQKKKQYLIRLETQKNKV